MSVFEYALFRFAAQRMTPDEVETAKALAELADHGNPNARMEFRELALKIVRETSRDGERAERQ